MLMWWVPIRVLYIDYAGLVGNVYMSSCKILSWDLPVDGGKCISEYRVRVYNGNTYATSSERSVHRTYNRRLVLPVNGTVSVVVSSFLTSSVMYSS